MLVNLIITQWVIYHLIYLQVIDNVRDFLLWPPCISGSLSWKTVDMPTDFSVGNVNNTHWTSLNWYTEYGMDLNCVRLLVIACVFSIVTYLMFPAHCSIHLNHYTGLVSVSIPAFIHPCIQSSGQTAVQPAQALSQSRWVVQTNHCCSPMLWPASVPTAALTPSSFSGLSFFSSLDVLLWDWYLHGKKMTV